MVKPVATVQPKPSPSALSRSTVIPGFGSKLLQCALGSIPSGVAVLGLSGPASLWGAQDESMRQQMDFPWHQCCSPHWQCSCFSTQQSQEHPCPCWGCPGVPRWLACHCPPWPAHGCPWLWGSFMGLGCHLAKSTGEG